MILRTAGVIQLRLRGVTLSVFRSTGFKRLAIEIDLRILLLIGDLKSHSFPLPTRNILDGQLYRPLRAPASCIDPEVGDAMKRQCYNSFTGFDRQTHSTNGFHRPIELKEYLEPRQITARYY